MENSSSPEQFLSNDSPTMGTDINVGPAIGTESTNTETTTVSSYQSPRTNWVLWLVLILLVGIGLGVFLWLGLSLFQTTPTPSPPVSCTGNITNVPDVSDTTQFTPCCQFNGQSFNQNGPYYDSVNDWTVMSLTESDIPAANQVCIEFCSEVSLPSTCNGLVSSYTNCLSKLIPQNCTDPALPAAKQGVTPFYAIGRGQVSCYPCSPCPS